MIPEYYKSSSDEPITCIEAIRAALTPAEFAGFCKGNVIKYVWRERGKGRERDLAKALDYVQMILEKG